MELDIVVVSPSGKFDEVPAGLGGVLVVHLAEHPIRVGQRQEDNGSG